MDETTVLELIKRSILDGDHLEAPTLVKRALDEGIEPMKIITGALVLGMDQASEAFSQKKYYVPELMLAARAMKAAIPIVLPHVKITEEATGKIIIGTVFGDIHDIGKNIVVSLLETAGFHVIDLGTNVSSERFIEEIAKVKPDILMMSALLTSTMDTMGAVMKEIEQAGLRGSVKIAVGGAPVTEEFALHIGADGYGEDAVQAVRLSRKFMDERR